MSPSRRELRVVLCLFLVLFLGVADNQVLSPLLPAIRSQMGRSSANLGFLFTGYAFCAGLSVLLWGPLSDVFGRRRGLVTGLLVFAAGSAVSFAATTFGVLLSGRMLTGMGASMLSLNTISYTADYFPYQRRGWAMGCVLSSYFAALILGVPLGSYLGDALGWNAVFGCVGAGALALSGFTLWLLPALPGRRSRISELVLIQQIGIYLGFLRSRRSSGALVSSFCASAGITGFLAFVGVWLHDSFGIPGRKIGLVFLASGGAALIASPLAGALSDRIGKRVQFVASNLAMALCILVLPAMTWGMPLVALFCAISLAAAFRQAPMEALLTEVVAAPARGSFIALKNSFSQLGIGLAALASGLLFESGGYFGVCLLGAILNVCAAGAMVWLVREPAL